MSDNNIPFDTEKEFGNVEKEMMKKGYEQLKEIIFGIFDKNSYMSDEENIAITKDMVSYQAGVQYDKLIDLWFKLWKQQVKLNRKERGK